jgi:hypothetical protein
VGLTAAADDDSYLHEVDAISAAKQSQKVAEAKTPTALSGLHPSQDGSTFARNSIENIPRAPLKKIQLLTIVTC